MFAFSLPIMTGRRDEFQAPLSHIGTGERCHSVDLVIDLEAATSLDAIFHAHFSAIARSIARVIRDPARAEELAVEVFLKWSRTPGAQGPQARGWLFRSATRAALDELRGTARRERLAGLL